MTEQVFDSDYTATIMDENQFVADQQTQLPAYLVPHSALMDFDGRVYRAQKGPRFGLDIEMGLDDRWFAREDAGRMAALRVELDHAYIDRRAALEPVQDVRPTRARRRAPRSAATAAAAELPEPDMPPLVIPIDDSDDEEYSAGQDDEEEEEEDDDDDGTLAGGAAVQAAIGTLDDARDRRSALEILRSRHGSTGTRSQRAGRLRPAHQDDSGADEVIDIESIGVDASNGQAIGSGRALRSRRQGSGGSPADGPRS
ncbi:hypothetical protein H4R19_006644, partial [Coemansia spiralis]